jgi:hypothetical protein
MKLLVATEMIGGRFHRIRSSAAAKCAVRPKLRDIFTRPGPKADLRLECAKVTIDLQMKSLGDFPFMKGVFRRAFIDQVRDALRW